MKKEGIEELDNSNNSMDLIFNAIENDEYEKKEVKYFYGKLSQRPDYLVNNLIDRMSIQNCYSLFYYFELKKLQFKF